MSKKESWLYGINPVREAIKSGRKIRTIYIAKQRHTQLDAIIAMAQNKAIAINFTEKDFFDSRFHKGHQGIAAIVEKKAFLTIDELLQIPFDRGELPFFLVLDCIEDPRNFGAILRVADAAGIHGVIYQFHRSAGLTDVVSKASAGASEYVNLVEVVNIKYAIEKIKMADINIIGAEVGSQMTLWDIDMKIPLAFVVGSEGKGLRRTVGLMCDFFVDIPMKGKINSLNVSMAAGILSYEVLRQRRS